MQINNVLITGAGGYIGTITTQKMLEDGYSVVALDNFSTGYLEPLKILQRQYKNKLTIHKLDIRNSLSPIKNIKKIDGIIHFAAHCSIDESTKYPHKYFDNNLTGTINLLGYAIEQKISSFIFSSTCAVYGKTQPPSIDEKHPVNPLSPYGESKLMAEKILAYYSRAGLLNYVALRYFNVCGASEDGKFGDSKNPSPHLVQNVVRSALGIEKLRLTYKEVDTKDKSPIRDYINVVDLASAHLKSLLYLAKGRDSEIINLGTENGYSVLEIIKLVEKETGSKIETTKGRARRGEYPKMVASSKKAKRLLCWTPTKTIEQSISDTVSWYRYKPRGWKF